MATRSLSRQTPRRPGEPRLVDTGPFVEWLRRRFPDQTADDYAGKLGIDPRQLRSYITGEYVRVSIDTVDRALVVSGEPWTLRTLYPELYEGMAT